MPFLPWSGANNRRQGSLEYFKHAGTSPFSAWYVAGLAVGGNFGTGAGGVNILRALPLVLPHGGEIDRVIFNNTSSGTTSNARVGVYVATSTTNLYPSDRIFDSGPVSLSTSGIKQVVVSPNLYLSKDKLYWLCYVGGGLSESLRTIMITSCYPIFGISQSFVNASPAVGLQTTFTFGPYPSTFPAGAGLLTVQPIPALAVRLA